MSPPSRRASPVRLSTGAVSKSHAVYLSVFQLVPYERIQAQFAELYQLPLSAGSLFNFNRDAFERLPLFLALAKQQLSHHEAVLNVDETSVNVGGKRVWLHNASNEQWTLIEPHARRGKEAMDAMGVLPEFNGYLVHDHWKPYYQYNACTHALCNAHHKRELTYAWEQDGQRWAQQMERLLDDLNCAVKEAGGCLPEAQSKKWRAKYRRLLNTADKECPPPAPETNKKTKGRQARSKSRNLLERLGDYEADVLRFMDHQDVPFTNNQGERDIRMSKVQQKNIRLLPLNAGGGNLLRATQLPVDLPEASGGCRQGAGTPFCGNLARVYSETDG